MSLFKRLTAIVFILILSIAFQNCGQGFNQAFESQLGSNTSENSQGDSSNDGQNGEEDPPVTPPVVVTPPVIPPVAGASTLSEKHINDQGMGSDPAVLFYSGFENNFEGWNVSSYTGDSATITSVSGNVNSGTKAMKAAFTLAKLNANGDAAIDAIRSFETTSDSVYVRYYTKLGVGTARPHHFTSLKAFAPGYDVGGTAGLLPNGNQRFNTTLDIDADRKFFFYTYWHQMHSWQTWSGQPDPSKGSAAYYGNMFKPAPQSSLNLNQWNCIEIKVKQNTPNSRDGELSLWVNNQLAGEFKTGAPQGQWCREIFFVGNYPECPTNQYPVAAFEGFNFRTSSDVKLRKFNLQTYQEAGTLNNLRGDTATKSEEQAIYYDDVVIATQRIGCKAQ